MCVASNYLCIWDLDINQSLGAAPSSCSKKMERVVIGVSWQDHRTNEWVRSKTKARDIMHGIKARKWTCAGHIARLQDNRWTSQVTDWRPMDGSRPTGRPSKRWSYEIIAFRRSVTWKQNVQDRLSWKRNAEAFIQQVDWEWLNIMMTKKHQEN